MTTYEIIKTDLGDCLLRHNEDGSVTAIPQDEANADYQAYLNKDKQQVEHLTEIPTPDEA